MNEVFVRQKMLHCAYFLIPRPFLTIKRERKTWSLSAVDSRGLEFRKLFVFQPVMAVWRKRLSTAPRFRYACRVRHERQKFCGKGCSWKRTVHIGCYICWRVERSKWGSATGFSSSERTRFAKAKPTEKSFPSCWNNKKVPMGYTHPLCFIIATSFNSVFSTSMVLFLKVETSYRIINYSYQ